MCPKEGNVEEAAVGDKASVPHPSTHTYTHTRACGRARTTIQAVSGQEEGRISITHPRKDEKTHPGILYSQSGAPDCNVKPPAAARFTNKPIVLCLLISLGLKTPPGGLRFWVPALGLPVGKVCSLGAFFFALLFFSVFLRNFL